MHDVAMNIRPGLLSVSLQGGPQCDPIAENGKSVRGSAKSIGWLPYFLIVLFSLPLKSEETERNSNEIAPLAELLKKLPDVASDGTGMNQEEQDFAEAITKHGATATDALVEMLVVKDPHVYQLVTYCLLELKTEDFKPEHLKPMAKAARERRGWLPNAIADIGTDEAARFLVKDFRRLPQTMAQIDNAVERMAPRSIAPLLAEFQDATEDEEEFMIGLVSIFRDCEERAALAVEPLLKIALDSSQPVFRRQAAIQYLGAIGPAGQRTFSKLRALAEKKPEFFEKVVREAIAGSRTSDAADMMIEEAIIEAREAGEIYRFRDMAIEVGKEASHLADRLIGLLDDENPNVKLGACRTLGFLGVTEAEPHLARMLEEQDWRVVFMAIQSLKQLESKKSRVALEKCHKNYWYPKVRRLAGMALGTNESGANKDGFDPFNLEPNPSASFFAYDDECEHLHPLDDLKDVELIENEFVPKTDYFFALPEDKDLLNGFIEGHRPEFLEATHPKVYGAIVTLVPEVVKKWMRGGGFGPRVIGLDRRKGETVVVLGDDGSDSGVFLIEEGKPAEWVFRNTVRKVFRWNGDLVVLSGGSDWGEERGEVHRIVKLDDKWKKEFLYALPGWPESGGELKDGRLFANCSSGAVAIDAQGKFEYLGSGSGKIPEPLLPLLPE